jgi:hypothetical protein
MPHLTADAPARLSAAGAAAHQELVHRARGLAAFADGPHHQRLAAAHVAGGKDLVHVGGVAAVALGAGLGVAAGVLLDAEGVQHGGHRVGEAHGQQHQVGLVFLLGAGHFDHLAVLPLHVHGLQRR